MLNLVNLLATSDTPIKDEFRNVYLVLSGIVIILMAIAAITAIVLVLLQPSNSSGIDALGGSSETFFGKNKGKSIEEKMKKMDLDLFGYPRCFGYRLLYFARIFRLRKRMYISAAFCGSRLFYYRRFT